MKIILSLFAIIIVSMFIAGCGDPQADVTGVKYEPKIAVEAFLFPGDSISGIILRRNFPLNTKYSDNDLYLTPENNSAFVEINGTRLNYNSSNREYSGSAKIDFNTKYTIFVSAVIEGKKLEATSETITPKPGFRIVNKDLGTRKYGSDHFIIEFFPSAGTEFYGFSIIPLDATLDNFIYDNKIFPNIKREDVEKNFNQFKFQAQFKMGLKGDFEGKYSYEVMDYDAWFYSRYRAIVYAGDENYRDFWVSNSQIKEMDGNYHEPVRLFKGDALGVFASAIRDTVFFEITR